MKEQMGRIARQFERERVTAAHSVDIFVSLACASDTLRVRMHTCVWSIDDAIRCPSDCEEATVE